MCKTITASPISGMKQGAVGIPGKLHGSAPWMSHVAWRFQRVLFVTGGCLGGQDNQAVGLLQGDARA